MHQEKYNRRLSNDAKLRETENFRKRRRRAQEQEGTNDENPRLTGVYGAALLEKISSPMIPEETYAKIVNGNV